MLSLPLTALVLLFSSITTATAYTGVAVYTGLVPEHRPFCPCYSLLAGAAVINLIVVLYQARRLAKRPLGAGGPEPEIAIH